MLKSTLALQKLVTRDMGIIKINVGHWGPPIKALLIPSQSPCGVNRTDV